MSVVMGEFLTVFRYQKRVNKIHIWLFSLRNRIFRIFHSKIARKRLISHFRQCAYLQCHPLHCSSSLLSSEATYHDFLVFWRVSFEWKITYMFYGMSDSGALVFFSSIISLTRLLTCLHSIASISKVFFYTH